MYKSMLYLVLFVAFLSLPSYSFSQKSLQLKKTIAIADFEDATNNGSQTGSGDSQQTTDPNAQPANGQQAQSNDSTQQAPTSNPSENVNAFITVLTTELVRTNLFNIAEGQQSGEGTQLMIEGTITKWQTTQKTVRGDIINTYHSSDNSSVTVAMKIVDGFSGKLLDAKICTGDAKEKNLFNKKADITLDSAISRAASQCVDEIKVVAAKIGWEGSVVKVSADGDVFIQPGSSGGVSTGMVFDVYRKGDEIKDDSGQSLGFSSKKVGSITVSNDNTTGNGNVAEATITSGKDIKKGDTLKPQ